jgi:DNA-binding NarL/FixJ family response regulator
MGEGADTRRRILLADDHEMVRAGLRSVLEKGPDLRVVAEADDGRKAIRLARELTPDVVVMDISMPEVGGIEATRQIMADVEDAKVIILSMHADQHTVGEALRAGAVAYLIKSGAAKELRQAIDAVLDGRVYLSPSVAAVMVDSYVRRTHGAGPGAVEKLTPRERDVLKALAEGKTNKEIAADLYISVKTVETHRAQLMEKLNIHTVAGLTKFALRHGLASLDG